MSLGSAPVAPVTSSGIAFGTYRGSCASTDLGVESRVGRLTRLRHERRWQRFWVADNTITLGGCIAIGPAGIASLWVFDREEREMLVDTSSILPPFSVRIDDDPTAAAAATARFVGCRFATGQRGDRYHVLGRMNGAKLTFGYEIPAADPVTAVCPIDTDHTTPTVNITQKSACLPVSGWINADGRRHRFADAVGMLDYSHGLLGRETTWRWAIAGGRATDGTSVGFNVVDGFNDGLENVIWVDGTPRAIGSATTEFEHGSDWRIETADGELSITLDSEGIRRQDVDLGPFYWTSNQPLGRWYGTIATKTIDGITGIAEIHRSKW